MPRRSVRVATEDAERACRPRGVAGFFALGNGVCGLCGTGLGKRYTRTERKEHEQGWTHRDNHVAYLATFEDAVMKRLERQCREAEIKRADAGRSLARDPIALTALFNELKVVHGVAGWMDEPEADDLKAAIFDAVSNPANDRVAEVLCRHKARVGTRLVEKAASTALGDGGHLVASLCQPCIACTISRRTKIK